MTASPAPHPLTLVLATANADKASEIEDILGRSGVVDLRPRPADLREVAETGETLIENARLKARAVAAATGEPSVADDTGLEVDALGGAPGVHSARYAGEHASYAENVAKLLSALDALPDGGGERRARFVTVAVVAFPDGAEVAAEGTVEGVISQAPRGVGGFGYDPVFVPSEGSGLTFAEMSATAKNAGSHRGRAFGALARRLQDASGRSSP